MLLPCVKLIVNNNVQNNVHKSIKYCPTMYNDVDGLKNNNKSTTTTTTITTTLQQRYKQ